MILRIGSRGHEVLLFQRSLIALGYDLPRWGVDGAYGHETDDAADAFARDAGLIKQDSQATEQLQVAAAHAASNASLAPTMPASVIDARALHDGRKRLRRRSWRDVTSITLHQTATCYLYPGASEDKTKRAIARVSAIGVHATVLRPGFSVFANDLIWEMPQAQYFNANGIGIEIDGRFCGVEGDLSLNSFWRPRDANGNLIEVEPMAEEPAQTKAALELIDYFVDLVASNGGQIRFLNAHRQTSAMRRSDPGEIPWKTIAIPAMQKHSLSFGGPDFFVKKSVLDRNGRQTISGPVSSAGPGRPIPRNWDPSATAVY